MDIKKDKVVEKLKKKSLFLLLWALQMHFSPLLSEMQPNSDLDRACRCFEAGNFKEAKEFFIANMNGSSVLIRDFAKLGLAKVALEEKNYSIAEELLNQINSDAADLKYERYLTQGDLFFRLDKIDKSLHFLEMARPKRNFHLAPWGASVFSLLGRAYLKQAELEIDRASIEEALKKAEMAFQDQATFYPSQQNPLEISLLYTTKAHLLNDPKAREKGTELLNALSSSPNPKVKVNALRILGDNAFSEGEKHKASYLKAADYYEQASVEADSAGEDELKLKQAASLIKAGGINSLEKAKQILDILPESPSKLLLQATHLIESGDSEKAFELLKSWQLSSPYYKEQLFLIGKLSYDKGDYPEAEKKFLEAAVLDPESTLTPLSLYWGAQAASKAGENPYEIYRMLYEQYPSHPLAAIAYYDSFTPTQYLLGTKAALKHLHQFRKKFPNSPIGLQALYLVGLDQLHDRSSPEGKALSKINLTGAIDAFQEVETLFDRLYSEGKILNDDLLPQMIALRYLAILEKAKANLAIASQAKPAKQLIFLDYAEEVFSKLKTEFETPSHPLLDHIRTEGHFHPIEEEALYSFALISFQKNDFLQAKEAFTNLCTRYQKSCIQEGYFLSRSLYQLGLILKQLGNYELALDHLDRAIVAGKSSFLSSDEILDILIEKSEIHRLSGSLDLSMLQLSEAVNYEAISSLRLKAMYLRAEIYALQGRPLLARKQLESLANKEGIWAQKAKVKLEKEYGFD